MFSIIVPTPVLTFQWKGNTGSPSQHGKTHLLGKCIVCCKLYHVAFTPGKAIHGERVKWVLLCLPKASPSFSWGSNPTRIYSKVAPREQCSWLTGLSCPTGSQMWFAWCTNKTCLSSVLVLKTWVNLTASLGSFLLCFCNDMWKCKFKSFPRNVVLFILHFSFIKRHSPAQEFTEKLTVHWASLASGIRTL